MIETEAKNRLTTVQPKEGQTSLLTHLFKENRKPICEGLRSLWGPNAPSHQEIDRYVRRIIWSYHYGTGLESRMGRPKRGSNRIGGIADKDELKKVFNGLRHHAVALRVSLQSLPRNASMGLSSRMIVELPELLEDFVDECKRAQTNKLLPHRSKERNFDAKNVEITLAKIYSELTGRKPSLVNSDYPEYSQKHPGRYRTFVKEIFLIFGIAAKPAGIIQTRLNKERKSRVRQKQ